MSEPTTPNERALASLRHLYEQMTGGVVRDTFSAVRIATGLLGPAIEALERAAQRTEPAAPVASTAAVPEGAEAVACPHCNGTREVFTHAEDCTDDLCALNGDMHSCAGRIEPCECAHPPRESGDDDDDAQRYRAFFDSGLPVCFMGQEFRSKEECDKAIDAARTADGGTAND